MTNKTNDIKVIYNPYAGKKRRFLGQGGVSLEDIKFLMEKYQLLADFAPIKKKNQAGKFSKESIKQKYETVIAAGGDGTINEVANSLINSEVTLGILPLGTFMNIARMLSIPTELEKAIMLIKINRTRMIDVGCVTEIDGQKLDKPYHFIETAGIGLDAEIQHQFKEYEEGNFFSLFKMVKTFISFYAGWVNIDINGETIKVKSTLITISNGPYTGAALNIAPDAKLNDHKLTLSLYKMTKWELIKYFFNLRRGVTRNNKKIKTYKAEKIKIYSPRKRFVHADATLFGITPVEFSIVPNALKVICGFPSPDEESSLVRKTFLDPR